MIARSVHSVTVKGICVMFFALTLAACDDLPGLFDAKEKPKLPGKRIEVLASSVPLAQDDSLADTPVTLPEQKDNENWRQAGGSPQGMTGNLKLQGMEHHDKTGIGDGNGWEQPLYSSPVVAGGVVYAMDSHGYITAHDSVKIRSVKWKSEAVVAKDESDILGGGLAFDGGKLFVTTGRGDVFALDAATGKQLWKNTIGVPLRAAPKAGDGRVYAVSVDNQLFAFDAEKGTQLWSNRGINENAGFLASISPAVSEAVIIAPYSSGEIHALDSVSGQTLWNDTLLKAHHNSAAGAFSGIGGNPIIKDDAVYAAGSGGVLAAFALTSGRRLWEQEISSLNMLWIGGDFIYALSADDQLVCLARADGRVKWVSQLPRFENEKKHKGAYYWRGPVLAGDQLLVAGMHGKLLVISPKDGTTIRTVDIPEYIADMPVIAGGRIYMLTKDAKLHTLY